MKIWGLFLTIACLTVILTSPAVCQLDDEKSEPGKWIEPSKQQLTNARIEFEHTTFDFGSIVKGAVVTHKYWFENKGTDTLVITRIKSTCGCTSTQKAGFSIPPGGRSNIDIVFDAGKFNGRVTKSININCNDALNPYLEIRFKAHINNPKQILEYSPQKVDFENVEAGAKASQRISITNTDSAKSKIVIVDKPDDDFISADFAKKTLNPNATEYITFSLNNTDIIGKFQTSISLEIKDKRGSRISIPIIGNIVE